MRSVVLALALLTVSAHQAMARDCQYEKGEERWDVKNSVESVGAIPNARAVSLASLIALKNPPLTKQEIKGIENTRWTGSAKAKDASGHAIEVREGDIITVTAYVYRVRCQKDGDFHMEIGAGAKRSSKCLIVEVPDPGEIQDTELRKLVSAARDALAQMDPSVYQSKPKKNPIRATITGQLFLDAPHFRKSDPSGGRGTMLNSKRHCASNLWEIHPVVGIE